MVGHRRSRVHRWARRTLRGQLSILDFSAESEQSHMHPLSKVATSPGRTSYGLPRKKELIRILQLSHRPIWAKSGATIFTTFPSQLPNQQTLMLPLWRIQSWEMKFSILRIASSVVGVIAQRSLSMSAPATTCTRYGMTQPNPTLIGLRYTLPKQMEVQRRHLRLILVHQTVPWISINWEIQGAPIPASRPSPTLTTSNSTEELRRAQSQPLRWGQSHPRCMSIRNAFIVIMGQRSSLKPNSR